MPKERQKRHSLHDSSARLGKRAFVSGGKPELVEIGRDVELPTIEILSNLEANEEKPVLTKKEKQQLKHDTFIQRLESGHTPYSRSHVKRMKRKAKEQIASGLDDIAAALPDIFTGNVVTIASNEDLKESQDSDLKHGASGRQRNPQTSLIGEGKGAPLSKHQRKQVLKAEKIRQSLLLATPEFTSNPFQLLRIHAQNTLVKHKPGLKQEADS